MSISHQVVYSQSENTFRQMSYVTTNMFRIRNALYVNFRNRNNAEANNGRLGWNFKIQAKHNNENTKYIK